MSPTDSTGRRTHSLRGGDGTPIPEVEPPELWPDIDTLAPYWNEFTGFARSELNGDVEATFRLGPRGSWKFIARQAAGRSSGRRERMTYDPETDTIQYYDPEVDSGWTLTDAFGRATLDEQEREMPNPPGPDYLVPPTEGDDGHE
jgi:hypothetical protein